MVLSEWQARQSVSAWTALGTPANREPKAIKVSKKEEAVFIYAPIDPDAPKRPRERPVASLF
jgi:hypothetical protein